MPYAADATIAVVLDEALREAREDLAELDRLGTERARVPEDDPAHQDLLDVRRRHGLAVGLLTQDTALERPDRTVRDIHEQTLGARRAEKVPLGSLGLMHEVDVDKPVGHLSVGQRRRLALALLVARPPQLLLLDEPTNHLSPALCDELEAALGPGPGAIVVAGHDRWLRRRWQGRELRLNRGGGHRQEAGPALVGHPRGRPDLRGRIR